MCVLVYVWLTSRIHRAQGLRPGHVMSSLSSVDFPDSSSGKESACNAGGPGLIPGLGISPAEGIGYPFQYSWASLVAQLVKKSTCNMGGLGSIPGLGRSSREGKGCLLQYFGLKNSTEWGLKESDMTEQISFSFTFFCGQFTLRDCVLKEEGYLFPWYIFLSTLREWISHVSVIFDRLLFRQSSVVLFTCVSTSIPLFTKN